MYISCVHTTNHYTKRQYSVKDNDLSTTCRDWLLLRFVPQQDSSDVFAKSTIWYRIGVVCQSVSNKNNSVSFSKSQIATENSNLSSNCLKYQYYHVPSRPFQGCSTRTAQGCFPEVKQQNLCIKHLTENNHIFQRNLFLYHNLHPYSILGSLLLSHRSEVITL